MKPPLSMLALLHRFWPWHRCTPTWIRTGHYDRFLVHSCGVAQRIQWSRDGWLVRPQLFRFTGREWIR